MGTLFADTSYYVALFLRTDNLTHEARRLAQSHMNDQIVTCEAVWVELFAHLTRSDEHVRLEALGALDDLRRDPLVTIVPQTGELFEDGLELYRRRLDKRYSLTDCMCMTICTRLDIREVLTHDHNFEQEGFTILL